MDNASRLKACSAIFHTYAIQPEAIMMLPIRRTRGTTTDELHVLVRRWFDGLGTKSPRVSNALVKHTENVPMSIPADSVGACRQIKKEASKKKKTAPSTTAGGVDEDAAAYAVRSCAHAIGIQLRRVLPMTELDDPNDDDLGESARFLSKEDMIDGAFVEHLAFWDKQGTADSTGFFDEIATWQRYADRINRVALVKHVQPNALLDSDRLHMLFSPSGLLHRVRHFAAAAKINDIAQFQNVSEDALKDRLAVPTEDEGAGFRDGDGRLDEDLLVLIPGRWIGVSSVESAMTYDLPPHSVAGDVCAYAMLVDGHTGLLRSTDKDTQPKLVPVVAGQVLASYTLMLEDALKTKEAPTGVWVGPTREGGFLAAQENKGLKLR